MSAVPIPDPRIERSKKVQMLEGELPSSIPLHLDKFLGFAARLQRSSAVVKNRN